MVVESALEHEGAVSQSEAGGEYAIGATMATLGEASSPTGSLRSVVRPFIEELALLTGGSAGFTMRDRDHAYWVDNIDDADELVTLADQTGRYEEAEALIRQRLGNFLAA